MEECYTERRHVILIICSTAGTVIGVAVLLLGLIVFVKRVRARRDTGRAAVIGEKGMEVEDGVVAGSLVLVRGEWLFGREVVARERRMNGDEEAGVDGGKWLPEGSWLQLKRAEWSTRVSRPAVWLGKVSLCVSTSGFRTWTDMTVALPGN